jgi:hypothetical protein
MPKKIACPMSYGEAGRQSTAIGQLIDDLQSPEAVTRAAAVRSLCPCRTAWDIPVQRYVAAMREDPSRSVRHEVHHVLDEDSHWGKKLQYRHVKAEIEAEDVDDDPVGAHSIAWRRRPRPRTKGAAARMAWSPRPRRY